MVDEFIDVHSHIAWGVDDGIEDVIQARKALQMAMQDKITTMIATPHFIPGRFTQKEFDEISQRMNELKVVAKTFKIEIYTGCEFFLNDDYFQMLEAKMFYPLANSNYVLMEFDVRKNIGNEQEVEDKFYEFIIRGYRPIIAHAERYFHQGIDLDRIENWIEMGCYIQVNRTSLLGLGGKMSQKNAEALLRAGLVHVIGSDMHRSEGTRIAQLSDAYELIKREYGSANADLLCKENAQRILNNEALVMMEKVEKKKRFSKLWKRGK